MGRDLHHLGPAIRCKVFCVLIVKPVRGISRDTLWSNCGAQILYKLYHIMYHEKGKLNLIMVIFKNYNSDKGMASVVT